ncbi:MAG: hypothetical protein ACFE0Q_11695 [Anaerolineae bacterium]
MVEPFYIDTSGAWVLGHNQQQGAGSHLQAGARAELIPSPITRALSTFGGRIAAQTMQYMFRGSVEPLLNYVAFRPYALMEAIRFALGEHPRDKIVLDPASGYSPVYYWLAQQLPHTQFIEMDQEKMIDGKHKALDPFGIAQNLGFHAVDLSTTPLHTVQSNPVDVMVLLGAYVDHGAYADLLRYVPHLLKQDGYIVSIFPNKEGIENFQENSAIFSRIVSEPRGAVNDLSEIITLFKESEFKLKRVISLSELADKHHKPVPADVELIAIARLGGEDEVLITRSEAPTATESESVPPFIDFDLASFQRFPRHERQFPVPRRKPRL